MAKAREVIRGRRRLIFISFLLYHCRLVEIDNFLPVIFHATREIVPACRRADVAQSTVKHLAWSNFSMKNFICVQCGMQFDRTAEPRSSCPICEDERQFVRHTGRNGQRFSDCKLIITIGSKMKRPSFLASAQNPNLRSGSALYSCNHLEEICFGIVFHCSTVRPPWR